MMDGQERTYQFRGQLNEKQHSRFQWLGSRRATIGFLLFLLVMFVINAALNTNLSDIGNTVLTEEMLVNLVGFLVFSVICVLGGISYRMWKVRHLYRDNVIMRGELSGTVADSGIEIRTEVGNARYRWDQVLKAKIAPEMVLIYTSPQSAIFLLRNFFGSDDSWHGALDIVRNQVKKLKGA